jgi:hypothetical protein
MQMFPTVRRILKTHCNEIFQSYPPPLYKICPLLDWLRENRFCKLSTRISRRSCKTGLKSQLVDDFTPIYRYTPVFCESWDLLSCITFKIRFASAVPTNAFSCLWQTSHWPCWDLSMKNKGSRNSCNSIPLNRSKLGYESDFFFFRAFGTGSGFTCYPYMNAGLW